MIIYKITNRINGKVYIGQTTRTLNERWKEHCSDSRNRTKKMALHKAIQKYGKEHFTVEQIDVACDQSELNYKEMHWIAECNSIIPNGYNLTSGGEHPVFSEETRRKISEANKGEKNYFYGKRFIGALNPFYGRHHTEKTKKEHGDAVRGYKHTEEAKRKMSLQRKGKFTGKDNPMFGKGFFGKDNPMYGKCGSLNPSAKRVVNITLNLFFDTAKEAAKSVGKDDCSAIIKCCRGRQKTAYGYKWEYAK